MDDLTPEKFHPAYDDGMWWRRDHLEFMIKGQIVGRKDISALARAPVAVAPRAFRPERPDKFEQHKVEKSGLIEVTTITSIVGGDKATHGWIEEKSKDEPAITCYAATPLVP